MTEAQAVTSDRRFGAGAAALHDRLTGLLFVLACSSLTVMLGAYLYEVVARYVFGAPTLWSSDVVQYSLCVATALAWPAVARDHGHIAITSLLERLGPRLQRVVARGLVIAGALTLVIVSLVFIKMGIEQHSQGVETVAQFSIPKWWLTALVGIGFLDSMVHMLRQAISPPALTGQDLDL